MEEVILAALFVGIAMGIIPAILGAVKNRLGLGIGGFFACVASGLVLGLLLAVPVCALFVWLILKPEVADT